jgi:hypothetical protein
MSAFETMWRGASPGLETTVEAGKLTGSERPDADPNGHIYVIRLVGRTLTTLTGGSTDVLYIGQGTGSRVHQLWSGQHSVCKRLAWAGWAQRGDPLRVGVEVQPAKNPELREVELLNAFLWEHGQMPVLNGKHEGWLPSRVLQAVARDLKLSACKPYNGPRRPEPRGSTFTGVDLYGAPSPDKAWHWRGSLLWLWPVDWMDPAAHEVLPGFRPGAFVLIACRPVELSGWHAIPAPLQGPRGWLQGATPARAKVLHPGVPGLGHPELGPVGDLSGLVAALSEACRLALPETGVMG